MITFKTPDENGRHLAAVLSRDIAYHQQELEKLKEILLDRPGDALEWSAQDFRAAATVEVYRDLMVAVNRGTTLEQIARRLFNDVIRSAAFPPHSTSVQSNQMYFERLAVKAALLEKLATMVNEDETPAQKPPKSRPAPLGG